MRDRDQGATTLEDLAGRNFATVPETAEILGYDPRVVRRAISDGEIPATKAGATYRVPVAWLRQQAGAAVKPG